MTDEKTKSTVEQRKTDSEQAKTSADEEKLSQDELEAVSGGILVEHACWGKQHIG